MIEATEESEHIVDSVSPPDDSLPHHGLSVPLPPPPLLPPSPLPPPSSLVLSDLLFPSSLPVFKAPSPPPVSGGSCRARLLTFFVFFFSSSSCSEASCSPEPHQTGSPPPGTPRDEGDGWSGGGVWEALGEEGWRLTGLRLP